MTLHTDFSPTVEIHIDESACDGCGLCIDFCPVGVLELRNGILKIVKLEACYACRSCEDLCPHGAIGIVER